MLSFRKIIVVYTLFVLMSSCYQRSRDRATNIIRYLAEVHHIRPHTGDRYLVAILENSFCGACNADVIIFIREQLENGKRITIVFQQEDSDLQILFSKYGDVSILVDTKSDLERYGLLYAKSRLYILDRNRVTSSFPIVKNHFEKIDGE
jgi:hypothetical protein